MSILPGPASYSKQRRVFRRSNVPISQTRTLDILFSRARITNLGFLVLASFAFVSFIYNLYLYSSRIRGSSAHSPHSILSTLSRPKGISDIDHLIIVPGHSIWTGSDPALKATEDQWLLEPYQKGGGRVAAFLSHIVRGAELALQDEHSLLVFSGGQTRRGSTTTESESYLRLAIASDLFSSPIHSAHTPFLRATTENYALDSYQNFLFSIARFHEYTGRWPIKITVVGYEMKRRRFEELHREAVRWPTAYFHYVGIDADGEGTAAQEGEYQNGYKPYVQDSYGCHSMLLAKRRGRNPFSRFHSYYTSSPELAPLLSWCPDIQTRLFPGPVPWDISTKDS